MALAPNFPVEHVPPREARPYGKLRICEKRLLSHISDMNWKSIRLELGSTGEFPAGSVSRAYLIRLPLDDYDVVDRAAFLQSPSKATIRRHWSTEPDQRGTLVQSGHEWAMSCDNKPQRILQLNGTPLRLGQHVSVIEPDGTVLPFKIASVR